MGYEPPSEGFISQALLGLGLVNTLTQRKFSVNSCKFKLMGVESTRLIIDPQIHRRALERWAEL